MEEILLVSFHILCQYWNDRLFILIHLQLLMEQFPFNFYLTALQAFHAQSKAYF